MRDEDRKKIEEIMDGMRCPKGFACAENGFENLCRAEDIGLDKCLQCLEGNPRACPFAMPYGSAHYCQCPLRVYLAQKLQM